MANPQATPFVRPLKDAQGPLSRQMVEGFLRTIRPVKPPNIQLPNNIPNMRGTIRSAPLAVTPKPRISSEMLRIMQQRLKK